MHMWQRATASSYTYTEPRGHVRQRVAPAPAPSVSPLLAPPPLPSPAPAAVNWPAGQTVQRREPVGANLPGGQLAQCGSCGERRPRRRQRPEPDQEPLGSSPTRPAEETEGWRVPVPDGPDDDLEMPTVNFLVAKNTKAGRGTRELNPKYFNQEEKTAFDAADRKQLKTWPAPSCGR